MLNSDIDLIKDKLIMLKKTNPLKFERFKGRLDALYEIEYEKNKITDEREIVKK